MVWSSLHTASIILLRLHCTQVYAAAADDGDDDSGDGDDDDDADSPSEIALHTGSSWCSFLNREEAEG